MRDGEEVREITAFRRVENCVIRRLNCYWGQYHSLSICISVLWLQNILETEKAREEKVEVQELLEDILEGSTWSLR